jgi:hypothetical protein
LTPTNDNARPVDVNSPIRVLGQCTEWIDPGNIWPSNRVRRFNERTRGERLAIEVLCEDRSSSELIDAIRAKTPVLLRSQWPEVMSSRGVTERRHRQPHVAARDTASRHCPTKDPSAIVNPMRNNASCHTSRSGQRDDFPYFRGLRSVSVLLGAGQTADAEKGSENDRK